MSNVVPMLKIFGEITKAPSVGIVRRYLRCGECRHQEADPIPPGPVSLSFLCPNCTSAKINLAFSAEAPEWWAANG